jgi:recombination protein RecT
MSASTAEPMPRASQYKSLKDIRTVDDAVDHPEVIKRFQNALGSKLDAVQFLATIRNLTRENDDIRRADVWELLRCALDLAELGLRPNTPFGHAWIIPRIANRDKPNEAVTLSVQLGYQGMLELAYRAGTLESIHADVVYEGDEFSYEYGSKAHLRHVPAGARKGRSPRYAYAHAMLKGGGEAFVVWGYEDILDIRNSSDAYKYALRVQNKYPHVWESCVWVKFEYQQSRKTILKQLLKDIPRSSEFLVHAAHIDNLGEAGRLTYAGAPGDLDGRGREIAYQQSMGATLHDFGLRTATVNGDAEVVSQDKPKPTEQKAADQPKQNGKPATTATAERVSQGWESGPPAGMFDDGDPDPQPEQAKQGGMKVKDAIVMLRLIDADGVILAEDTETPWAEMYVEHLQDVPPDLLSAFREHNEEALVAAFAHPTSADVLRQAGIEPPTIEGGVSPKEIAGGISSQGDSLVVKMPEGRARDHEVVAAWEASLQQVGDEPTMIRWRAANAGGIGALHSRIKLQVYKAIASRSRALGIVVPQ